MYFSINMELDAPYFRSTVNYQLLAAQVVEFRPFVNVVSGAFLKKGIIYS